jgi:uncharacterized membrane protein
MNSFSLALASFVLLHVGVAATPLRAALVARFGERAYRAVFSLASAALLLWLILAYGQMRADPYDPLNGALWAPAAWARPFAHVLVFVGFMFAIIGVLTPGPTFVGFEGALNKDEPARGVLRITRHPFLWGVAFWATGHLIANGERFALMLFGALGLMALYGARSIDRKGRARNPEGWARFEAVTSNAPFAAIVQGRNTLKVGEIGWRALAAVVVFALVGFAHPFLFGVPAFSTWF